MSAGSLDASTRSLGRVGRNAVYSLNAITHLTQNALCQPYWPGVLRGIYYGDYNNMALAVEK